MRTVLFVDDEQFVLDGLAMALRKHRHVWDMCFASTYEEALAVAESRPPDAVVSDLRMPGPGGIGLLSHFRDHHPGAVRLALTGHANAETARDLTGLAHRFLGKPCPPDLIYETVERVFALRDMLESERLRGLVGRMGHLPAMPHRYLQLAELLRRSDTGAARIAAVIEGDPAVAARVLHVVNSGFFGRSYSMRSLEQAVAFLGFDLLQSLVLSMELLSEFAVRSGPVDHEVVGRHSLLAARIARALGGETGNIAIRGESRALAASTAALLHNLGVLVLNCRARDLLIDALAEAHRTDRPLTDVERERVGATHDQVGAYLLGLWGFPMDVLDSVAHLHARPETASFDQLDLLRLATGLATECIPLPFEHEASTTERTLAAAQRLGLDTELERWRERAYGLHGQLEEGA